VVKKRKPPTGIAERHSRRCRTKDGGACNCKPAYRAFVFDRRTGTKIRKTFPTLAAAKKWRADATSMMNHGKLIAPRRQTLAAAAEAWLAGAQTEPPEILTRSDEAYKPSTLREYERNLRNYVLPDLGAVQLADIRRGDLQQLVKRLRGKGLSGSKIRNVLMPLRVIFRHALDLEDVAVNPTSDLKLPNGHKSRDRAASATEAASLLAALPEEDRALWATAFYAGLRRGELRALRWSDVDLAAGVIHVRRGWDDMVGEIAPKSAKGTRKVPIIALLRDYLTEAKARTERDGDDFVFGPAADRPFTPSYIRKRAATAWGAANVERVEKKLEPLTPIGLHECRHTFVSLCFDAGLRLEEIGDYVGHSSTYMTDHYRHLIKGHETTTRDLLDDYFARADTAARIQQVEG
jgi:integrase